VRAVKTATVRTQRPTRAETFFLFFLDMPVEERMSMSLDASIWEQCAASHPPTRQAITDAEDGASVA
jgi:hypothetical protein